jgi:hypothetical protein
MQPRDAFDGYGDSVHVHELHGSGQSHGWSQNQVTHWVLVLSWKPALAILYVSAATAAAAAMTAAAATVAATVIASCRCLAAVEKLVMMVGDEQPQER